MVINRNYSLRELVQLTPICITQISTELFERGEVNRQKHLVYLSMCFLVLYAKNIGKFIAANAFLL